MNRKIISIFLLTIVAASAAFFVFSRTPKTNPISPEERQRIIEEHRLFSDWYEDYVYNLEQLDFCWQQYHRILSDLRTQDIDSNTAWDRLKQLKSRQLYAVAEIKRLAPPEKLRGPIYDQTASIYKKTLDYANAQAQAIDRSLKALDNDNLSEEELSRKADECCIAEAPPALFTADEIAAVRDYLQIDEN